MKLPRIIASSVDASGDKIRADKVLFNINLRAANDAKRLAAKSLRAWRFTFYY